MPPGQRSQYGGNPYWLNQRNVYKPTGSPSRLYEGDIIRAATQPANYKPAYPTPDNIDPSWYMNSRAYANAKGVQAGLGVPNSSNATDPASGRPGIGPASRSGGGGRSGGGVAAPVDPLAGYVPQVADLSKDPYAPAYAKLADYIKQSAAARPLAYAAANADFQKQYDAMNAQLQGRYDTGAAQLNQAATNLGLDPTLAGQTRADAFAHTMDNSALTLQGDKDFLTKMGLLDQNMTQAAGLMYAGQGAAGSAKWGADETARIGALNLATLQFILDQKLAAQKAASGRGRGGGGGGSSKGDTSVTETSTLDPAIQEQYLYLAGTNPKAAAEFLNMVNLGSGGVLGKAQGNVNQQTAIANRKPLNVPKPSPTNVGSWLVPFIANNIKNSIISNQAKTAKGNLPISQAVLAAAQSAYGPLNPKTKITQTKKGKVNTNIR